MYVDDLLVKLAADKIDCFACNLFAGVLAYADDITYLASTPVLCAEYLKTVTNTQLRLISYLMPRSPNVSFVRKEAFMIVNNQYFILVEMQLKMSTIGHILSTLLILMAT